MIGKLIRLPLRLIPGRTTVRVLTGGNRGYRWVVGSSVNACWLGIYERETQRALERIIRPGMTVLDAGANVGYFSLMAARLTGPNGHVLAFEPFEPNAHGLTRHIALNRLGDRITVVPNGLADRTAESTLFVGAPGSASIVPVDTGLMPVPINLVALDDWRAEGRLPTINAIKMDIEGAEGMALFGMQNVLASDRPGLYVALHGGPREDQIPSLLRNLGYTVSEIGYNLLALPC